MRLRGRIQLTRRRVLSAGLALIAVAGIGTATAVANQPAPVREQDQFLSVPAAPGSSDQVSIDTSFFTTGGSPRPAVLLAHGFGGSKTDEADQARALARSGYAVLTWSARGFGRSTGQIDLNSMDGSVQDVKQLVDWLATRPEVQLDHPGDPRVGMAGGSYGGAIALLSASADPRIDAIAPAITWWDLPQALFPQAVQGAEPADGVFKKLWAGIFFTTGSAGDLSGSGKPAQQSGPIGCGRFTPELCAMYNRVAAAGRPDAAAAALLEKSSPAAYASAIKVPTLVVQGQQDSLFPLDQGDQMAKAIAANGQPVSVDWFAGGHDGGLETSARVQDRVTAWFDRYLKQKPVSTGPAFRVTRTGGVDSTGFQAVLNGADADRYPGLSGTATRQVPLTGGQQAIANPPGGAPPAISTVPGLGALTQAAQLGLSLSMDFPGQSAGFDSAPLDGSLQLTGAPEVSLTVEADRPDAVLFAKLYDLAPDGKTTLPQQLAAPLRVTGADAPGGRTVTVRLPAVDYSFPAGHRLRLTLASTDLAYASPAEPATYKVAVSGAIGIPTDSLLAAEPLTLPDRVWILPLVAVAIAAALLLTGRRRRAMPPPDPELAGVPLKITGLSKRYKGAQDRYAVRDLSFTVEPGQVLGLLGPNGAGKTTTLRMLMGLIRPDQGEIQIFGHAVRPGAPVLSRVGAFVEGAGFLPHLSGRANLELYWRSTGRPAEDAHLAEALEIADLGEALERAVRTYSQGMRQRLAIAQAMLGLPDLLILDEPTNGLDPPQIREMREVMIRYAGTGRTVIVSSHLLSEVEQSCTHLVVMDRGRLVTAGEVAEIVGSGELLLVGTPVDYRPDQLAAAAGKLAELPGIGEVEVVGHGLLVRLAGVSAAGLIAELVRLDVPVERAGPHRRLEDAFLSLIGGGAA
ncbi:alpha/beta fold hydrolase [Kitasatospora sp. NPDC006697]|uniref:alpha/beta fold hydrolase n=1 Tax=Kitasatospora sp. NPDC006697 TaxID=3364020 RepID=UPI0036BD3450